MRMLLAAIVLAGMVFGGRAEAASGWRICNHTSYIAEVAVARPLGTTLDVRGWLRLRPGQCRQAAPAPLAPADHFLFARSSRGHKGGQRLWGGETPFCVADEASFSISGATDCRPNGYRTQFFQALSIGNTSSWTTRLLEAGDYTRTTAQAAGLQRLLNDVGIGKTVIDGYIGRRTRAAINRFIRQKKLPAKVSDRDLIDVLENEAGTRAESVGLRVCNRAGQRIWTAVGHFHQEEWESLGWWEVDVDECARVLDYALPERPLYVLAEMRVGQELRQLTGASHVFCISNAKFAISGRRLCRDRLYDEASFVQTGMPEDTYLKVELFEGDFTPIATAARARPVR